MERRSGPRRERRANPRVAERFPVKISTGGKTYRGLSCDVSLGGLACSSPVPLPVSTQVKVDLILPVAGDPASDSPVICRAKVVRTESPGESGLKDYRLAFNFGKMSKKDRQELASFISRKLSSPRPGNEAIMTESADISANGIFCKSDTYIPTFREVEINVIIPDHTSSDSRKTDIRCSGVVVRCEKERTGDHYEVALYFTDINLSDRARIRKYLRTGPAAKV